MKMTVVSKALLVSVLGFLSQTSWAGGLTGINEESFISRGIGHAGDLDLESAIKSAKNSADFEAHQECLYRLKGKRILIRAERVSEFTIEGSCRRSHPHIDLCTYFAEAEYQCKISAQVN